MCRVLALFMVGIIFPTMQVHAQKYVEVERIVIDNPRTIRGLCGHTIFSLPVDAPYDTPYLYLDVTYSSLVDPRRSVLTVLVDGAPRKSERLSDIKGRLAVPLYKETRFQEIRVEALLNPKEGFLSDERLAEALWITILPSSRARWTMQEGETAIMETGRPVSMLPGLWQGIENVRINPPRKLDLESSIVTLDVDHLLRDWGFTPSIDRNTSEVEINLTYNINDLELPDSYLRNVEDQNVRAVIYLRGQSLYLYGEESRDIARAVALLRDNEAKGYCNEAVCLVGPAFQPRELDEIDELEGTRVLNVSRLGFNNGWRATGDGLHRMRWVWQRPPWWEVMRWPEIEIFARFNSISPWFEGAPSLTVLVNEQPLSTYQLGDLTESAVALRTVIPEQFWDADVWVIDIEVDLSAQLESCGNPGPRNPWLVIEPASGLKVPRTENIYGGIADLYDSWKEAPSLLGDSLFFMYHLEAAAALLYPFRQYANLSFEWDNECTDTCVRFEKNTKHWEDKELILSENDLAVDKQGTLRIPVLEANALYQIKRLDETLLMGLPPRTARPDIPGYLGLLGSLSIYYEGSWRTLRIGDTGVDSRVVTDDGEELNIAGRPLRSDQGNLKAALDVVWGILLFLFLFAALFWMWRSYRLYKYGDSDTIEYYKNEEDNH